MKTKMSNREFDTLVTFSKLYGRSWKRRLYVMWETANYTSISEEGARTLQRLRNASYFGPTGLDKFRAPKESQWATATKNGRSWT